MKHLVVGVGGMSCQGCVKNVTGVLRALPGVSEVKVSLEAGRAEIDYDPQVARPAQFREAIEGAGFDVAGEGV
ncbi:MAG: heavy-metal-associated domain-containing protein [Candidatus Accumulibacter sp.]|nr:heavy-metal-associated domain-containing protein [Accumulibacter sp.]